MSGLYFKDYVPEYFKELAKDFKYYHRTRSYYVHRENDGYINISCECQSISPIRILFNFQKNYYQGIKKPIINYWTHNFDEFVDYMCNYHKKLGRKYKLKKLMENE